MPTPDGYQRVLLKISGESLSGPNSCGIDADRLNHLAAEIVAAAKDGCQIAVVIGGGNIVRGSELAAAGLIPHASADHMGMLGTMVNGIALKEALVKFGQPAKVLSALAVERVLDPIARDAALRFLQEGHVLVLAGGTGNPFCTTDTAAALRAIELDCDAILKATKVDGVYSDDPMTSPDAIRHDRLTFAEALAKRLRVMDLTAFSMCMEHNMPIVVFDFAVPGNIQAVVRGEPIGTVISSGNDGNTG